MDTAGAADASSAPTIVRPDLVGYQDSTAIFLSQRHGLLAVKTDGPTPVLSCALKLPGQPKYFFYRGSELVLLVNGIGVNEGALLRFRVTASGFDFVDSVMLDDQSIQDARLFDSTLVVYTALLRPVTVEGSGAAGTAPSPLPPSARGRRRERRGRHRGPAGLELELEHRRGGHRREVGHRPDRGLARRASQRPAHDRSLRREGSRRRHQRFGGGHAWSARSDGGSPSSAPAIVTWW